MNAVVKSHAGEVKASNFEKLDMLGKLQSIHNETTCTCVDALFSIDTATRDEFVHEYPQYPLTMVDFADIPKKLPDMHLMRLIVAMLDNTYKPHSTKQEFHDSNFLLVDTAETLIASPELLRVFAKKLKSAIDVMIQRQELKQQDVSRLKKYFLTDDDGAICFAAQQDIIDFVRKTPIKQATDLSDRQKVKYNHIICSLLIQMIRHHDFKGQKKYIHSVRELLEKFIRGEFIKLLAREAKIPDSKPITDISHVDYFEDKVFILRREILEKFGVQYFKDIHFTCTYRAKSDESILDKLMIEPLLKTADTVYDIGGLKLAVLGKNQKDERLITLYVMFLLAAQKEQMYNTAAHDIAPANSTKNAFLPNEKYAEKQEIIEKFLEQMTIIGGYNNPIPLLKDKGVITLTGREGFREIDEQFLQQYGMQDARFATLLQKEVQRKNDTYRKEKERAERSLDTAKKNLFLEKVCNTSDIPHGDRLRKIMKNYDALQKRSQKVRAGNPDGTQKNTEKYEFSFDSANKHLLIYAKQEPAYQYQRNTIETYFTKRYALRKEQPKSATLAIDENASHKGAWQDVKIATMMRMGDEDDQKFPLEVQVLGKKELQSLPLIDDHAIFQPAKKLLVFGRNNSGVLSLGDIEHIIDVHIIQRREKHPDIMTESGYTLANLQKAIEKDDTFLPAGGTFKEKIRYNFLHNRGLKKHGTIYLTKYYFHLHHHGLTPTP